MMTERTRPYLHAYVWWCGDELCDCTQPVIERVEDTPGRRWPTTTRVWEGRFLTDSGEYSDRRWPEQRHEQAERMAAFRNAAHQFGVPLHTDRFGNREGYCETPAGLRGAADKISEAMG